MTQQISHFFFIAMIVSLLGISGCAGVRPWEREYLADETMQFDPDPLKTRWHLHVEEVLEGSRGGFSDSGGGCGCR
ncbi:MAG: DUF4266 domain-containing protein [Nitrospiria bacterium]